jgi:hypothetical protein
MFNLLKDAAKYQLLCEAGLREDMAKRIMYSVLPAVADPNQVASTKGVVDYKALRYAAEGRTNLIKFGMLAVLDELKHYRIKGNPMSPRTEKFMEAQILFSTGDLIGAIEVAINAFNDGRAWETHFGGEPWSNIAKCLKKIIILDNQLKTVKRYSEEEIQILQMIVVEMNVFDGLSHNTDSVMRSLVEQETLASGKYKGDFDEDVATKKEFNKIKSLMDAKELGKAVDVYSEIEQTLSDSGEINKYKEWNTKLRTDPNYNRNIDSKSEELFKIKIRKMTQDKVREINISIDHLKKQLDDFDNQISNFDMKYGDNANAAISTMISRINELAYYGQNIPVKLKEMGNSYISYLTKMYNRIRTLKTDLTDNGVAYYLDPIDKEEKRGFYLMAKDNLINLIAALSEVSNYIYSI